MSRPWIFRALAVAAFMAPLQASARATFTVIEEGTGFNDPTPTAPVGENAGVTLGEQRRLALARALEIWSRELDSPVPIVVRASFRDLGCTQNGAVLAQAFPKHLFSVLPGAGDVWHPSPLADRIAGRDLSPGSEDLHVEFNTALDYSCRARLGGWYYGFDAAPADQNGMIATALHELAHGLGFASWVNLSTGAPELPGQVDVFTSHIVDLDLQQSWAELSDAQRASSATNVRRVAWGGELAQRAAREFLSTGHPTLTLEPSLPGFSGFVADASGARNPAQHPVRSRVVAAQPRHGCAALANNVRGAIVLLAPSVDCDWPAAVGTVLSAGGAAALFLAGSRQDQPASPLEAVDQSMALPVAVLSRTDSTLLSGAMAAGQQFTAQLGGDASRPLGADPDGRPLLFSPSPLQRGSSISHFEILARPSLLLEPYSGPGEAPEIDPVTLGVMRDIGWVRLCGNGQLDPSEQCDDGQANSDRMSNACRTTCEHPACGDGVLDSGEGCDSGKANSDVVADACRTSCVPAHCGDSVLDRGEECDQGANSDVAPNACRPGCVKPRCGDGVVDDGELCDHGPENSDRIRNACRADCRSARCGDGVLDANEQCDGSEGCSTTCALIAPQGEGPGQDDEEGSAPVWQDPSPTTAVRRKDSGCMIGARSDAPSPIRALTAVAVVSILLVMRRRRRRGGCSS